MCCSYNSSLIFLILHDLGLDCKNEELFMVQMDFSKLAEMKIRFEEIFLTKTKEEWVHIFDNKDACVTPILNLINAHEHEHKKQSASFMYNAISGQYEPKPAPHLENFLIFKLFYVAKIVFKFSAFSFQVRCLVL